MYIHTVFSIWNPQPGLARNNCRSQVKELILSKKIHMSRRLRMDGRRHIMAVFMVFSLVVSVMLSACGPGQLLGPTLTPTPTITLTPLPSPTFTPTPLPTATPTPVTFTNDL